MCTCTRTSVLNPPLHEHPTFRELETALWQVNLAADALKGLGNLLRPTRLTVDEQLDAATRANAADVFQFFGEALAIPADLALAAANALEMESYQLAQGVSHE